MGGAILPQAPSYEELPARFRWQPPEHYNIGVDACDRWADPDRLALIHLDADGREARYRLAHRPPLHTPSAHVRKSHGIEHTDRIPIPLAQAPQPPLPHPPHSPPRAPP